MKNNKIPDFLVNHSGIIQAIVVVVAIIFIPLLGVASSITELNGFFISQIITVLVGILIELITISSMIINLSNKLLIKKSLSYHYDGIIEDFIYKAKRNVYITGINNQGVISFLNFKGDKMLKYCLKHKIHLNFLISYSNSDFFNWFLKMYLGIKGNENMELHQKTFENYYFEIVTYLNTNELMQQMKKNNLLTIKFIDIPITTGFVAYDIESFNGEIKCSFYQYNIKSSMNPSIILDKSDEMYIDMIEVLKNMWNNAVDITEQMTNKDIEATGKYNE